MLDFQIKRWNERSGGLNVGLCPGRYSGQRSRDEAIFIAESSFSCIEPTIKECSLLFSRKYSHWGVTEILQDEWSEIIPRLETLREDAARSSIPGELLGALPPSEILESEFRLHFEINRKGLLGLLDELIAWLQSALRKDKSVSILGL